MFVLCKRCNFFSLRIFENLFKGLYSVKIEGVDAETMTRYFRVQAKCCG